VHGAATRLAVFDCGFDKSPQCRGSEVGFDTRSKHDRIENSIAKRLAVDPDARRRGHQSARFGKNGHFVRGLIKHEIRALLLRSSRRWCFTDLLNRVALGT
jgi:hypothetical protein